MFYVGIDVSKNHFTYCIINSTSQIIRKDTLTQTFESFKDFLSIIKNFQPSTIIMESSGRYHICISSFLISHNIQPFIINPKFSHQFFKFIQSTSPSKTDSKDAFILALFALKNPELLKPSSIPEETKIIARTLQSLKKELAKIKTQILNCLSVVFPELERVTNPFSKTILNILLYFPSAKDIAKAPIKRISAMFEEATTRGKKPSLTPEDLKELAKKSIGISHKGYSLTLKTYIQKLFFLEKQIEELSTLLDEEIQKWSPKEIDIISSIKGISRDLANRFIAEIEDIKKFSSAKKLIKYAGLDPVIKQSGKWKFFKGISKKGNAYLRDIFYQMAYGVVTWNSFFREYLKKKMAQYGSYRKAMIAVVNKLIRVIFAMLKKGEKFRPERVFPSIRFKNSEVVGYV